MAAERICPEGTRDRDLPTDQEVNQQLQSLRKAIRSPDWERRFEEYSELLRPLAEVSQHPTHHPEGDALYHSLQVFELACHRLPYDEEFLTAALLHDVGKAVDRRNPLPATLEALAGLVTPRTVWFIENLPLATELMAGTLGSRARRRLEAFPDYDELMILAECDRDGRVSGARVTDMEDAIQQLREIHDSHEDEEF